MKSNEDTCGRPAAAETGVRRHTGACAAHCYSFIWACRVCRGCGNPTVAFFPLASLNQKKAGPLVFMGYCAGHESGGKD